MGPGSLVGADALLLDSHYQSTARVRENVLLLQIESRALREIVAQRDRLAFKLLHSLVPQLGTWLETINQVVGRLQRSRMAAGDYASVVAATKATLQQDDPPRVLIVDTDSERRAALVSCVEEIHGEATSADSVDHTNIPPGVDVVLVSASMVEPLLSSAAQCPPVLAFDCARYDADPIALVRAGAEDAFSQLPQPTRLLARIDDIRLRGRLRG